MPKLHKITQDEFDQTPEVDDEQDLEASDERYPYLAAWVRDRGWIEIGSDNYSWSAIRILDTGGLIWELIIGAIYLFTGVYLIMHPFDALLVLTLILACYLFFEAIIEFIQYFQVRPRHGAG